MSNSLDPVRDRRFVKGFQQTTKVAATKEKIKIQLYTNEGLHGGGVWYSLFIKNLAQYSSH